MVIFMYHWSWSSERISGDDIFEHHLKETLRKSPEPWEREENTPLWLIMSCSCVGIVTIQKLDSGCRQPGRCFFFQHTTIQTPARARHYLPKIKVSPAWDEMRKKGFLNVSKLIQPTGLHFRLKCFLSYFFDPLSVLISIKGRCHGW